MSNFILVRMIASEETPYFGFGIMKSDIFEDIQKNIKNIFKFNSRAAFITDHAEIWFDSYEEWNDILEIIPIEDSIAKATIKALSVISYEYDTNYVYIGDFCEMIDLFSELGNDYDE